VPTSSVVSAVDYDPKSFDPIAYVARAHERARVALPDAELTTMMFHGVGASGKMDLVAERGSAMYQFKSPSVGRGSTYATRCRINIMITADQVYQPPPIDDVCAEPALPAARCTLVELWERAHPTTPAVDVAFRAGMWLVTGARPIKNDCH